MMKVTGLELLVAGEARKVKRLAAASRQVAVEKEKDIVTGIILTFWRRLKTEKESNGSRVAGDDETAETKNQATRHQ